MSLHNTSKLNLMTLSLLFRCPTSPWFSNSFRAKIGRVQEHKHHNPQFNPYWISFWSCVLRAPPKPPLMPCIWLQIFPPIVPHRSQKVWVKNLLLLKKKWDSWESPIRRYGRLSRKSLISPQTSSRPGSWRSIFGMAFWMAKRPCGSWTARIAIKKWIVKEPCACIAKHPFNWEMVSFSEALSLIQP